MVKESDLRDRAASKYTEAYIRNKGLLYSELEIDFFLRVLKEEKRRKNRELRILEIGAGTGRLTKRIAPFANELVALDFSYKSLEVLEKQLAENQKDIVKTLCINLAEEMESLLRLGKFDAIIGCQVIQHISPEYHQKLFRIFYNMLNSGGVLVFNVYNFSSGRYGLEKRHYAPYLFYRFSFREVKKLLQSAGFKIERLCGIISLPFYRIMSRWPRFFRFAPILDSLLSQLPLVSRFTGRYIFAEARKE